MKNEIKSLKVVLVSLILCFFSIQISAQKKHQYIEKNEKIARQLSQKYGIPSAIILAIAFVETGGGTSKHSKTLNNHFGIVGKNTVNSSRYRSFSNAEESFEAFCKLLASKKYYASLKGNNDPNLWVKAIANAGYSTQPQEWTRRVNLILNQYLVS